MHKHSCNDKLSSLARGRGLLDGGVEIECFADDIKTFSLSGQRFIRESNSRGGACAKPYKPHCLILPKTYVTRKGHIVLFTAPEDMVLGQACQLHSREITSSKTVHLMKSSQSLVQSALAYRSQKKEIKVKSEAWMKEEEEAGEKGYRADLTKLYLNNLQRAAEKAREVPQDNLTVEDMEVVGEIIAETDRPDSSVDSGLGSCQVSSAQVLSLNSKLQDPTFSSRASESLLDEPDTLGPVEDDLSRLQTKLLDAYKPPSSKVNKISPHKSKKGKSRKTSSKGSTPTCTASTQKDNEQLSSSSYSRKKSWVREEGTEEDDPPIGEESRVPERRALQEEITRRLEEEIARRQEEKIARGQEEIARRQMEDEARKQKELDEQRRLERLKEQEEKRLAILHAEDKARAEHNLRMKAELADLRYSQTVSRSYCFSYFSHVPQKTRQSIKAEKGKPKSRKKN